MNGDFAYRFCRKTLWFLALFFTTAVLLMNLLYSAGVSYDYYEIASFSDHFLPSVLMLAVLAALRAALSRGHGYLTRMDDKKLFWILSGIYSIWAVYLIFHVDNTLRTDARFVYDAAMEIKGGIYDSLQKGGYLYRYPHQLGLVLYNQLLSMLSENTRILFLVNFLMVLGINHTWWKISGVLFRDKLVNILTLLFSFGFLPQLFYILFAYGLIPGFFFMSLGFYHTLRFVSTYRFRDAFGMALCTGTAAVLKQNYLIGGIAIGLFLLLHLIKKKNVRLLLAILGLVVITLLPGRLVQWYYGNKADVALDNGMPSVLWLAMGTDIENTNSGPGRYDHSSWMLYDEADHSKAVAAAFGRQKLSNNWEQIKKEPARAIRFFTRKNITQWCDPMFQSVWSGPLESSGQYTHTDMLRSLYSGGRWEDRVASYSKFVCLSIWLLATFFLLRYGKTIKGWELMFLYFIGGLLFHTVWEAKSLYTYTYVFGLIPFAACGGRLLIKKE